MKAEMAIQERAGKVKGWVLYDGDCPVCGRTARYFEPLLNRRGLEVVPLQAPWVVARLKLVPGERPSEMRFLTDDDRDFDGADAVVETARRIWWAYPLVAVSKLPGAMRRSRMIYRYIAARRYCINGACEIPRRHNITAWLPLILLPMVALGLRPLLAGWEFMWAMAFALYGGCKWLTLKTALRETDRRHIARILAYLFLWPGMDAKAFLTDRKIITLPPLTVWLWTVAKILLGALLVYAAVFYLPVGNPLLRGWTGMVGLILLLHFGLFELMAWIWRTAGVNATPIMNTPLAAKSLAEFWGKRWNVAFNKFVHDHVFRLVAHDLGVVKATLLVFLVSGLIHELVITLPVNDGYGGPTLFFMVQGMGLLFERTKLARTWGLGNGWRGWLFTMMCLLVPVTALFPAPFIMEIILPFLETIALK